MRTLRWIESEPGDAVAEAVASLVRGEIVAHPTETVYGIACPADDPRGYEGLRRVKGGGAPRAFLLLFDSRDRLADRLGELPPAADRLADAFWPGPLTLLVPAPAEIPLWWSGPDGDVAARVTPHRFCRELVERLGGPALSTSANRGGRPTPRTASGVAAELAGTDVTLIVDGGPLEGPASTILRWTPEGWSTIRQGPVSEEAIERVLGRALLAPAAEPPPRRSPESMNVLVVCTGNTCRSPMAAVILERLGRERGVRVRSAGTATASGYAAAEEAVWVARRHGLALEEHRTTMLSPDLLDWADHVLVMEAAHKRTVERMGAAEKVTLLSEYGGTGGDVFDPIGCDELTYEEVFTEMERYLENFLQTEQRPKQLWRSG